jgi:hypothetical protein
VDHPLAAPEALVRPWRTAALVASTVAAVELVLLLVIGGGSLLSAVSDRVEQAAAKRAHAAQTAKNEKPVARRPASAAAATVPRSKLRVVVLNGNGRQGAAAAAAGRVQRRGYKVGFVGNAPASDFARSLVMYRPGFAGEGKRFGRDVGVKLVTPLDGMRLRELHGSHLVFILGR